MDLLSLAKPTLRTNLANLLPKKFYKWLVWKWFSSEWPRHIHLELTTSCQLSCFHCPRPDKNEDMDYMLFRSIIDEASHYGPRSFSLHLFGEPLMYPRIIEAIEYIKMARKGNVVILTTNGLLLDQYESELEENGVDKIIWTRREISKLFSSGVFRLLKKRGLIRIFPETTSYKEALKWKGYQREIKYLHNYGGTIPRPTRVQERYPCYHLWFSPAVRYNGDFTLCCNDPYGKLVLGKITKEHGVRYYWNSFLLHEARTLQASGNYKGACKNCNAWTTYPTFF